jgi:hypothetical protein
MNNMASLAFINEIPLEYIQSVLKIDSKSETGLTWKFREAAPKQWNTRYANKVAGYKHISKNTDRETWRVDIKYGDKVFKLYAHRIVWLLKKKKIDADLEIDHINRNPLDNRIENLRLETKSRNMQNRKKCSRNTSGVKGVYWDKFHNKYVAQLRCNGVKICLGHYDTLKEAQKVVVEARKKYHGEFGRDE